MPVIKLEFLPPADKILHFPIEIPRFALLRIAWQGLFALTLLLRECVSIPMLCTSFCGILSLRKEVNIMNDKELEGFYSHTEIQIAIAWASVEYSHWLSQNPHADIGKRQDEFLNRFEGGFGVVNERRNRLR